jgi:hypothetical protein
MENTVVNENIKQIGEIIGQLPPESQTEVINFAKSLLEEKGSKPERKPRLKWVGALKHLRDEYTSLELEKKALELRGD